MIETITTIKDVANLAGVSPATVSRALNRRSGLSELYKSETILRVQNAAKKLNYQPNKSARMLINRKKLLTSILILTPSPEIGGTHNMDVLAGILSTAAQKNINISVRNCDFGLNLMPQMGFLAGNDYEMIDGLILFSWPTHIDHIKNIREILGPVLESKIPYVIANNYVETSSIPCVGGDFFEAGYNNVEYLIRQGHTRLALLAANAGMYKSVLFLDGVRAACAKYNINLSENNVLHGGYDSFDQFSVKKIMLSSDHPTAFITCSDEVALSLITFLQDLKFCVPSDVSVLGFGNLSFSSLMHPKLTTSDEHGHMIGSKALDILLELIRGNQVNTKIKLSFELVERESCALIK